MRASARAVRCDGFATGDVSGSQGNGFAAKKKTLHASERDTERVKALRSEWKAERQPRLKRRRVWFIDQMGVNRALTTSYARALGGARAVGSVPKNYGESVTFLGAMNEHGIKAALEVRGATDEQVMLCFIEEVLAAVAELGDVVVLDNLSRTKRVGYRLLLPLSESNYGICRRIRRI